MIYEKGRLSQLWKRLKGRGPRFINIHGEPWDKQTKWRFGAPDVSVCFYSAAAAGAIAALTTGFNNAAIIGTAVLVGTLYGTFFSRGMNVYYSSNDLPPIEKFAVDTKGKAFPPPNLATLLKHTSRLNTGNIVSLSTFVITPSVLLGLASATIGTSDVSHFFSKAGHVIAGKDNELLKQLFLTVPVSTFWGACTQQFCLFRMTKKLLDGTYVFCAPPSAKAQTEEAGVLDGIGQHSHAPIPVPVRR